MARFFFILLLFFRLFIVNNFSQDKNEFPSELFDINLSNNLLVVKNIQGDEIYTNEFQNPSAYLFDLDSDGINEFLVKDSIVSGKTVEYLLFIYNLLDTFYLAAEINSGNIDPFQTTSGEIEGLIIVSGNPDFSYLNKESEINALPFNCWKYEDGEIFSINEEMYEIFIFENDNILMRPEFSEINTCSESQLIRPLLATIYINYLNAGELSSAENLLTTFYLCEDRASFKSELDRIFYKENE